MPSTTDPIPTPPPGVSPTGESFVDHPRSHVLSADPRPTPEDQAVDTERRDLESGEESAT